ncbi:Lariat debranching enzyme [Frankliniella fusca]|uniref:Lariat debranching enzyme n=1 Tax=Frankliniella fusca TaxID=407009 RepID=A0AAE1HP11_9NEOP|nr:Lariat debranching enzyme [Frankliniella fusca]
MMDLRPWFRKHLDLRPHAQAVIKEDLKQYYFSHYLCSMLLATINNNNSNGLTTAKH